MVTVPYSGVIIPTFVRHGDSHHQRDNDPPLVHSFVDVPIPNSQSDKGSGTTTPFTSNGPALSVRETIRTVTIRESTGLPNTSSSSQTATLVATENGTLYSSDPTELVPADRNVRPRVRSRNRSPQLRSNDGSDTPTRTILRNELAARDHSVAELRGQFHNAQNRAVYTIEAQQAGFILASQRHEEEARLVGLAEANRVRADQEARIQALAEQESNTQNQLWQLEKYVAAARGQGAPPPIRSRAAPCAGLRLDARGAAGNA